MIDGARSGSEMGGYLGSEQTLYEASRKVARLSNTHSGKNVLPEHARLSRSDNMNLALRARSCQQ